MGMKNGYGNEDKALENPNRTKHNDIDVEGTISGSSSSLSSPSASSSSSPFCYEDQADNPEPQSPIPASLSYPDVSSSPHKWSMISASPSKAAGYDPNRIPMSVFGSRSGSPMEWSVASTESLFSIHVGNGSFSRDHASMSGELTTKCEDGKSFSSTLAPVIEGAVDNEEKSEVEQNPEEHISKIAASKEVHSFAMKSSNTSTTPSSASNPHRLSDDSGTSSSSFAFPVLVNDSGNATSLKSVPEKPESEQKPQPEESQSESSKEQVSSAAETGWFSYLFCLRRCC